MDELFAHTPADNRTARYERSNLEPIYINFPDRSLGIPIRRLSCRKFRRADGTCLELTPVDEFQHFGLHIRT